MKLNIGVFFGGESVEHEVSIISASQAMAALDKKKYNVVPIYVSKDRKFYYDEAFLDIKTFRQPLKDVLAKATQVVLVNTDTNVIVQPVKTKMFSKKELATIDVAIPVMHGTNGEDGTIQGYLEMLRIPYAGCDVISAAVGQDKVLQKHILSDNGLPLTNWFWCYSNELDEHPEQVIRNAHKLIYPVIVKPACTGSSIGISIAHNDEEYIEAMREAARYDFKIITEKVVKPMREINCSVLGDCFQATASVLEEVGCNQSDELLSFKDKYEGGSKQSKTSGMASTARIVPAPLSEEQTQQIQDYALKTFKALGASGVCRIDFMMDAETKTVYVNEINTIPGSLAFYLWKESNISFTELMDRLVKIALDRKRRKDNMTFSYDTDILKNFSANSAKGSKGIKM